MVNPSVIAAPVLCAQVPMVGLIVSTSLDFLSVRGKSRDLPRGGGHPTVVFRCSISSRWRDGSKGCRSSRPEYSRPLSLKTVFDLDPVLLEEAEHMVVQELDGVTGIFDVYNRAHTLRLKQSSSVSLSTLPILFSIPAKEVPTATSLARLLHFDVTPPILEIEALQRQDLLLGVYKYSNHLTPGLAEVSASGCGLHLLPG